MTDPTPENAQLDPIPQPEALEQLRVIYYPDPRLRKRSKPVKQFTPALRQLTARMFELMAAHRGVGLAAPQVGVNVRMFVMNPTGEPQDANVIINPKLRDADGEAEGEEGCLSLPDIYGKILRVTELTLEAQNLEGQPIELRLSGFPARVVQHEYDHLDGTLILDRMTPSAKMNARKKIRELEEQFAK